MELDLLIRNGLVMDPASNRAERVPIGVSDRKIVRLDEKDVLQARPAAVVDAAGCLVVPGLIDSHAHLFSGCGDSGIRPDLAFLPCGVTAGVDGGSAGALNYDLFSDTVVKTSVSSIKAYLSASPAGQTMIRYYPENSDPQYFDAARIKDCVLRHKDEIVAIKVRVSRSIVGDFGLRPLEEAVKIGEMAGLPVAVHTTDPPEEVDAVLSLLRPGDIYTHTFHGTGHNILGSDGRLRPCVREARRRGVLFDTGNGISHISFEVARQAIAEGFRPDTISSDETRRSMYMPSVHCLPYVMSKYLALGMSLSDILRATTITPAKLYGFDKMGTLAHGAWADIAVFRLDEKESAFFDTKGNTLRGDRLLVPLMTVKRGMIVYRRVDF